MGVTPEKKGNYDDYTHHHVGAEQNLVDVAKSDGGLQAHDPPATVKNNSRMFNFGSLVGGRLKSAKVGEFDSNCEKEPMTKQVERSELFPVTTHTQAQYKSNNVS